MNKPMQFSKKTTRRNLVRTGGALAAGGVLAGGAGWSSTLAQDEPITIDVWLGGEPGTVNSYTEIFDQFMAENPNVTVNATFVGSDLFNPTLLPALNAGAGPSVWMGGTGPGQPAAIIEAGHPLDITSYYCDYGWPIPDEIVSLTSSDGKLWSIGDSVETTITFYNRRIFDEVGVSVPETFEEFMAVCASLQEAGYEMPIGLGAADRYPISHWQTMFWGRYAGPEGLDEVMFGDGRWDEEHFVEATRRLAEINEAGYFGSEPLAIFQDDLIAQFWRGEVPMVYTGPWVIGQAVRDLGEAIEDFSVFQFPPLTDDQQIYPTEGIGQGWYINSQYEHPDAAADLLDFMLFREESREIMLESGDNVPVGPVELEAVELPTLTEEVLQSKEEYRENGLIHAFLDTVTPANMTDVTYDGLQALIAGQMTPEEFNAAVQAAWEEAKAEDLQLKQGGVSC
ncbi:MAG: extracellular solute-binding protein [Chloroflexota bacterium]|nr:extracellular solute-binding protein [Chloroflexota bacterium]